MGGEILLFTAYFEHSVGSAATSTPTSCKTCVFSRETGRLPFILGPDFNFPPSLWQDLSMHGGSLWLRKFGASVVIPGGTTHTCRVGKGLKLDIIKCIQHSGGLSPEYVVPGSVCEEHIDDLSQCVANMSRMQLFQDAALTGWQSSQRRHSQAGLYPLWQIDAPGKRQIPE